MDAVVLHSDIARLVLGYLKRQKLESTSRLFCKTSPHLKHEFRVYRSGFTPHSFCPDLEDIICEYVNIKHIVDRFVSSLTSSQRFELFELKLPEKVKLLLERSLATTSKTQQPENSTHNKNTTKNNSNASSNINSDKENTTNKRPKQKRKRDAVAYSSDERLSPLFLSSKNIKRRRILEPFCFISTKQQNLQRQRQTAQTPSTSGDQTEQTDDENEEDTLDEDSNEAQNEEENGLHHNETDLSLLEKPTKESTPHSKSANGKFSTPSVPELSQAILDNPQFQMKLVDNINQALNNSKCSETQGEISNPKASTSKMSANENTLSEEQQIITSNEMLDQMVKDILKATEQDPTFDAIVENVVGASIQPTNASAGVQCNIDAASAAPPPQLISVPAVFDNQQQQQQQFALVQQHQQPQLTLPTLSTISQQPTDSSTAPRTPLIIRTAISASNTSLNSGSGDAQILSTLTANNSFGSLIDPNFSISKLIVLNSNDSAQKEAQGGEQIIGNITADNLINHLTSVGDANGEEQQVFIDNATGQFVLLADEGILANFPFLLNGEGIIQQIQPGNTGNVELPHNEIPLSKSILAPAGQQPQNPVMVSSAQKVNAAEENEIEGKIVPCTACKKPQDATLPTSLQSRATADSETPSGSGIVNMKAFKSLSTPRKRTSHVRTLSFSPKTTAGTQAAQKSSLRPNSIAEECEELPNSADIPERPIIKNVEILPALGGPIDASANESSNSCSVPPLFVTEESSNQTVIKTELSLRETGVVEKTDKIDNKIKSAVTGLHTDTPKRKQVRKTAVRACKRQLSKSSDESETKPAPTTEVEQNEDSEKNASLSEPPDGEQRVGNAKDDKMMEEWLRLRNASNRDLDSRLRQINAEQHAVLPKSVRRDKNTSLKQRSLRRKRPTISKRMRKKARQEAHKKALLAESEADASIVEDEPKEVVKPDIRIVEKSKHGKCAIESRRVTKDRNGKEFNIKIPTPQKDKRESQTKTKSECVDSARADKAAANDDAIDGAATAEPAAQTADNASVSVSEEHKEQERDRRTANIACLLDTPFKAPTLMDAIPLTPGKPGHSLDTPAAKLRDGDLQLSTSYLFGSLTKSELDTPQLSAITPGLRFTPFGSSRDVTPRSGTAPTDYSSGGSYYKPDESEDLDRNFEKLLRDSAQKQRHEEEERAKLLEQHLNAEEVKSALFEEPRPAVAEDMQQVETEAEKICVEIPAEKLRVEPIVLKRVKSFGAEGTENTETTSNIDPHYTLVSELPEICADGESSDSSSTASTSTSSSSSNSSTSSSNSSTNSSTTTDEVESATYEKETPTKSANFSLSLDNLSTISSTEDEEWQKLAVTEEENSQLVSNDGEVRYPVRSWLTPSKVDPQAAIETHEQTPATTIKVTVPLKSAEKKNRLEEDLQQKRERMVEKLKHDANQRRVKQPIATAAQSASKSAALIASRKLVAMREKAKILPAKATMLPSNFEVSQAKLAVEVQEKRTMEVLTALQLSAKKQVPQFSSDSDASKARKPITVPPMASLDDNATTTLFTQAPTAVTYELTEKTERLPLKTLISKVKAKQRQCEQIEALPSMQRSHTTRVGRKKIVRKPLGFKGTNAPETVFEPDQLEEVKTPHKAMTKSVAEPEGSGGKDAIVSPVPRIRIKTPTGVTADRPSALRVSPRLLGNKKSRLKDDNTEEKEDDKGDTSEEVVVSSKSKKPLKAAKSKAATTAKRLLATLTKKSPVRTRMTKSKRTTPTEILEAKITVEEQKQDEDKVRAEQPSDKKKSAGEVILPVEHEKSDKSDSNEKIEKTKPEKKKDTEKKESKHLDKSTKASKKDKEAEKIRQTDRPSSTETKSGKHPVTETTVTAQKRKPKDNIETEDDKEDMTKPKTEMSSSSKIIDDASITNKNTKKQDATKEIQTRKDTRCEGQESNVDKLDVKVQDQAIVKEKLTKESEAAEIAPKPEAFPTSTTSMETETADTAETSEEDPLEHCELTSVTEEDPVRFISVSYDGPDGAPANLSPRRDFTNFKMVVAFDEEEKHIWRISNEMVLFSASPASQQIRNIPKKRKVRINTCGGTDNDNITTVGVVHSTTTTTASRQATTSTVNSSEERNQRENSSNEAKPVATSTPISAPATSSTEEPRRRTTRTTRKAVAGTEVASGSASAPPAEAVATSSAGPTDVLEIDDIESLLSRLHGKEN